MGEALQCGERGTVGMLHVGRYQKAGLGSGSYTASKLLSLGSWEQLLLEFSHLWSRPMGLCSCTAAALILALATSTGKLAPVLVLFQYKLELQCSVTIGIQLSVYDCQK